MSKKNSGADEPQNATQEETVQLTETKADEPKPDESKPDESKADDENEATARSIMKSHSKKEVWRSGDGYWFSVKDLAEFHASNKQTTLTRYSDDTAKG